MDISGLINNVGKYTCTLLIFSGRENPKFTIESPFSVAKLKGLFIGLTKDDSVDNSYPVLGYNGFNLQFDAATVEIGKGRVIFTSVSGAIDVYKDDGRRLESYLIEQAKSIFPELSTAIDAGI